MKIRKEKGVEGVPEDSIIGEGCSAKSAESQKGLLDEAIGRENFSIYLLLLGAGAATPR